jgi:hypothetical protein
VWHTEDHLRVLLLLLLVETDWNHQQEEEDTPIMLQQVSTPQSMKHTFKKKKKKKIHEKLTGFAHLESMRLHSMIELGGGDKKTKQINKLRLLACGDSTEEVLLIPTATTKRKKRGRSNSDSDTVGFFAKMAIFFKLATN